MPDRRSGRGRVVAWTLGALAVPGLAVPVVGLPAAAAAPASRTAVVSVLHALPAGGVVDVYAGRTLLVDDLAPGRLRTVRLAGGAHDLAVYPDGRGPGTATPLASAPGTRIRPGTNVTVAAHLTDSGAAGLTAFRNDTSTVGMGMGRLTVRHLAEAPPVDVRTRGSVLLARLGASREASVGLAAGPYSLALVRAGTRDDVLDPFTVTIRNEPGRQDMGTTTIVYLWGSAADGTLQRSVQEVPIDLD